MKAQVRIGGNTAPSAAAVLDLNATDLTNNGTGGLTLPRVNLGALSGTSANLNGAAPLTGMLVYNTNATLGVGIYFWNGSNWTIISGDGIVGNELTDTIAGGGLNKTGAGTATDPYRVGIKTGGITTSMIANGAVTGQKIATVKADSGYFLMSNGSVWLPAPRYGIGINNPHGISTARPPRQISWQLVVDTTVPLTLPRNMYSYVYVQGVNVGDFCVPYDQFYSLITWPSRGNNVVLFESMQNIVLDSVPVHFRCFRPIF